MKYIEHISDEVLQEMLAAYTERYSQLIDDEKESSPEFDSCRRMLNELQEEYEKRKEITGKDLTGGELIN